MLRAAALFAAVVLLAGPAAAEPSYFERLTAATREAYDEALRVRAPKLVPPVPVAVTWKAVRIGSLDLGAPLVAMTAGDLDGDTRGELYVVTGREVIAVAIADRRTKELGRVAFTGAAATPAPRDVVGTAVLDGGELVAAASAWATELRVGWQAGNAGGKTLVARAGEAPFLVCPGERLPLVVGRNHFGDPAAPLYGVRCHAGLVDAEGRPLRVRAALTGTKIDVTVETCALGGACTPTGTHRLEDYGVAFEVADLDRDGTPEVVVTGAGAPGDRDAVKVVELGGDPKKGLFRHAFNGGVAALAVIDSDGDGKHELVAAVRLAGATRVDLWRFN